MRKNNYLQNILTQFSYEHRKLDKHIARVRKSMDELGKLLDNAESNEKDKEKK